MAYTSPPSHSSVHGLYYAVYFHFNNIYSLFLILMKYFTCNEKFEFIGDIIQQSIVG
jgi:hypothetical protein